MGSAPDAQSDDHRPPRHYLANPETACLQPEFDVLAPDGSEVRVLLGLAGGGMAHFRLGAHRTTRAVKHRTVGEIWYVVSGHGEIWRRGPTSEHTDLLAPGVCVTIPLGTRFQFRNLGDEPLEIVAATLPPWPGDGEAEPCEGPWRPTV